MPLVFLMIVAHAQDFDGLIFNINYSYNFILYPGELYILEGVDNRSHVPIIDAKIRIIKWHLMLYTILSFLLKLCKYVGGDQFEVEAKRN